MMLFEKAKFSESVETYIRCINIELQSAKMLTSADIFNKDLGLIKH